MSNQIGSLKMGQKFKKTPAGEIPVDWEAVKILDIGKIVTGGTPSTGNQEYWGGNIPFITPSDMKNTRYIKIAERTVTESGLQAVREIPKNSVMVTCIASIGKMALAFEDCCTNQQINSVICGQGIKPEYLFYALQHKLEFIKSLAGQTAVPIINKTLFGQIQVPIPNIEEQNKISSIIWQIDDLIELVSAEIKKTKELKKGLMRQLLTRGIGHKSFKITEFGEIPADWSVATFQEVFDFLRTANNSREDLGTVGEVGYLHYGDIHTKWRTKLDCDAVDLPRIDKAKVEGIPFLQNGDLVLADASEDYDGIGVSIEVSNITNQRIVAGLHTMLLRDKARRFVDGFRGYIQYMPIVRKGLIKAGTGVSVYSISKGNLRDIHISIPLLPEQKKITAILQGLDETIEKAAEKLAKTVDLKTSLMNMLLTGKVRVS